MHDGIFCTHCTHINIYEQLRLRSSGSFPGILRNEKLAKVILKLSNFVLIYYKRIWYLFLNLTSKHICTFENGKCSMGRRKKFKKSY